MKNNKNTITWMAGKNVCEFDTATWYTKVHPMPAESFSYSSNSPVVNNSNLIQYYRNRATVFSNFICRDISMKGSITGPRASFRKKGNYTITLLQRNRFEYTDTLIKVPHAETETKMRVPGGLSNQNDIFSGDGEKESSSDLKCIHDEFYNNWVDRIYEFFELDDSWEGTFSRQSNAKNNYTYTIDLKGTV